MAKRTMLFLTMIFILITLIPVNTRAAAEQPRSGVVEFGLPVPVPAVMSGDTGDRGTGPNVNVTQNGNAQNETSIAVDPSNPANLVAGANDYRYGDSDAGVAYSFDGGATWVPNTLAGVHPSHGKYDAQGDPAIVPYRNGVFYYAFIDFSRSNDENRLAVAKTTDGGVTWPTLGVIIDHSGSGSHDFEDKEYIAVDNTGGTHDGNVYVTWTRFPDVGSTGIMFSRSVDGGNTYSAPNQISNSNGGYQGSVPAVGPNGEIYVAWYHNNRIEVDRSTNGGISWGNDVVVSNISGLPSPLPGAGFRVNSFPTIAVDRSGGQGNGYVYVAWADAQGIGSGPDVLFSRSTDGGTTWSSPIRVSDDTNQTYQWFPWMCVDPAGNIDVVFYDRRDVPGSIQFHTYRARSTNHGVSFGSNERVTDEISVATNDGFGGTFIGDYNGMCSSLDAVHPYWTDCRDANGNAEGYTAELSAEPVPDIKANGSDGPLSINAGDNLSLTVALDPGNRVGKDADWWLVVTSQAGWYYFDVDTGLWLPGFMTSYQGSLFAFNTAQVFDGSFLPRGTYVCYFAVDMVMNGFPTIGQAFIDSVEVTIN